MMCTSGVAVLVEVILLDCHPGMVVSSDLKRKWMHSPSLERRDDLSPQDRLVLRLERLRDAACEAVLWEDTNKIAWVAKSLANVVPTKEALSRTGVGHLLADKHIWQMGGDLAIAHANKALDAYKAAAKVSLDTRCSSAKSVPNGLVNMPAKSFLALVKDFEAWLLKVDAIPADAVPVKRLAALLVQNGFRHWSHLDSAGVECIPVKMPCQAALLARAVQKATLCMANKKGGANRRCRQGPWVPLLPGHQARVWTLAWL